MLEINIKKLNNNYIITKENMIIYEAFDTLYESIKNYNIFKLNDLNQRFKEEDMFNQNKLFQNRKIIYYSDDCVYEEAPK